MSVFPESCMDMDETTRRYAYNFKDLSCLPCKPQQSEWFQKDKVKVIKEPTYKKVDEDCTDVYDETYGIERKCLRTREVLTKGEYEIEKSENWDDPYVVYICEEFAREIYSGFYG